MKELLLIYLSLSLVGLGYLVGYDMQGISSLEERPGEFFGLLSCHLVF